MRQIGFDEMPKWAHQSPDTGSIKIGGKEILNQGRVALEDLRQHFGMTFQFGALFDSLPIWENVTFRLRHQQALGKAAARDIAAQTITQLGLIPSVIDQYPAELSGRDAKTCCPCPCNCR